MIPYDVAGLAISAAAAALRLGRRLDEILAEEAAVMGDLALAKTRLRLRPTIPELRRGLERVLRETEGREPDPLGEDRPRIRRAVTRGKRPSLEKYSRRWGVYERPAKVFDPDGDFARTLRERGSRLNLEDEDIRRLVYFVVAGEDQRENSLAFRLTAVVVDVAAEFGAVNAALVLRDPQARDLVQTVLANFAAPDLEELPGSGALLRHALGTVLEGLVHRRGELPVGGGVARVALGALARARDLAGEDADFFVGLLQGRGIRFVIRGALDEAAAGLDASEGDLLEALLASVLAEASTALASSPDAAAFFRDHWNELLGALLETLGTEGPRFLNEDSPLAQSALTAVTAALAEGLRTGPITAGILRDAGAAVLSALARDPEALSRWVDSKGLGLLLTSVAEVLSGDLRDAFEGASVEAYVRAVLGVLKDHPGLLVEEPGFPRRFVEELLGELAASPDLGWESLATTLVESALSAVAREPSLAAGGGFGRAAGRVAARLARLVDEGGFSRLTATALIEILVDVLAEDPWVDASLPALVLDVFGDLLGGDEASLLAGRVLPESVEAVSREFVVHARALADRFAEDDLPLRLFELLSESLQRVERQVGRGIGQGDVPEFLGRVVRAWGRGELGHWRTDRGRFLEDLDGVVGDFLEEQA
ncbi:MAG TPA: hypothetical protein ENK43_11270 [Planctomycetes bacterium]|nr:hypothetical protein [Planctomycetota bacterium]